MICQHKHPEDKALRCERDATLRFGRTIRMFRVVSGSDKTRAYAYTCDEHEEHGPALADQFAYFWAGSEGGMLLDEVERLTVAEAQAQDAEQDAAERLQWLAARGETVDA